MSGLKKSLFLVFMFCSVILVANDAPLYQTDFPPGEFQARWGKIFDGIGENAQAVVQGAPGVDGFKVFRQSNQFYYLCGLETPHAIILLDGGSREVSLFLPHRDEARERHEGKTLCAEDGELIKRLTGVHYVYGIEVFSRKMGRRLDRVSNPVLYTPFSPAETAAQSRDTILTGRADIASDPWDGRPAREAHFISLLKKQFPPFIIKNLSPLLDEMRLVKSPRETELIRHASELASLGIMEAMRSTAPGVMEYQLDAAARFVFRSNGARGVGYSSITAGGTNAWMGHYFTNNCALKSGDLVLMDFAPDYRYYTSDVTRMWPVNGKFSRDQRDLCGFILNIHDALLRKIRPGITASQVLDEAFPEMEQAFKAVKWSKKIYRDAAEKCIKWRGHLTHPVGMAVHDVGDYKKAPLKPGIFIALDPMMWVPEEKLYIRIENMVVVTENGAENLSDIIP
ncbi:MAG: aminopeptidase P family protein, partial [bacterium]|nr:aminopeptidase P family protein [bacterium]